MSVMTDSLDVPLHDPELQDEVELTVRLIVAANESDRVLTPREVDEVLGVPAQRDARHGPRTP
jgi:hypothetical protein